MKCPECGKIDNVVVSDIEVNAGIKRRRRCNLCGFSWRTYEFDEGEYTLLKLNEHKVSMIIKLAKELKICLHDHKREI